MNKLLPEEMTEEVGQVVAYALICYGGDRASHYEANLLYTELLAAMPDAPTWRPYIPGENQPEINAEVFVRFSRDWPLYRNYFVTAAALCGTDDLRWCDGRGEEMQGLVSHWMPMISAGLVE